MIDESVLERLLRDEAATYDVPEDGPAAVLEAAAVDEDSGPRRSWWLVGAAASVLVVAGLVAGNAVRPPSLRMPTSFNAGEGTTTALTDSGAADKQVAPNEPRGGLMATAAPGVAGAHVVRTGELWLEVPKGRVRDALRDVTRVAATHGGYVAESKAEMSAESPSGYVTIRVPVAAFDKAVEDLGRLGDVRHSGTSGEDVTAQVTDTAARLRSAIATRAQLRTLLARATDIGDVLAVQGRIDEVQTQIEKLQATQQSLEDRTSFGTLRVDVSPPGTIDPDREGFGGAWDKAVDSFVGGFEALVAASGTIAFLLLVGAALFFLARRAYRFWVRGVV
ncbi:MAG TPA: DUF4349 domain-containing protein [Frankiaceae bacterium]|nr:DUF4349 domain-containing protein [Frankiaceae bacterium]